MKKSLAKLDKKLIHAARRIHDPLARIGFFIIFFWFGFLKTIDASSAAPLVEDLFSRTFLPSLVPFGLFIVLFGIFEMLIGVLFLIPKLERVAVGLLILHLVTTALPLIVLPHAVWQGVLIPTLEGQYIIKNIVLLGLALGIASRLDPIEDNRLVT